VCLAVCGCAQRGIDDPFPSACSPHLGQTSSMKA
jgi:hypothetical protein